LIGSKLSRRYAKALLSLGQEDGQYQSYGENLQEFTDLCSKNSEFIAVISNQLFSVEDRKKILDHVLEQSTFADLVKNFLRFLLEKKKIGAIKEITGHYSKLTDEMSKVTRAEVITAKPLKPDAMERLEKALAKMTSKQIKTDVMEDESLIGGIVVKIGDLVLDGSVKAQLEGLKESLKRGEYR
jgi:F-type H+-transporting ATPase subunit delta